jgi:F1F0 ATPase subunit 2
MTQSVWSLILAFMGGMALGILHFGGLWLTVRHLPTTRWPWLCIVCSTLGRTGVSLAGFYLVMRSGWGHLLVCLGGFLGVRFFLIQRWYAARTSLLAPGRDRHGCHAD